MFWVAICKLSANIGFTENLHLLCPEQAVLAGMRRRNDSFRVHPEMDGDEGTADPAPFCLFQNQIAVLGLFEEGEYLLLMGSWGCEALVEMDIVVPTLGLGHVHGLST